MDGERQHRSRSCSSSDNYELNHIQHNTAGKTDMNRYRRANSTVQPGNLTSIGRTGSQKRSLRNSIRSDMPSFDQALLSFRDIDSAKKFYHRRIRALSGISCLMGFAASTLAIIDIEISMRRKHHISSGQIKLQTTGAFSATQDALGIVGLILKTVISVLALLTCITIYNIYSNTRKLFVVKNLYHESESFLTSRALLPRFLIETFICILHIPPFVDQLGIPYKLQLLVFLRFYLITRFLRERSKFFNNQATSLLASVTKTDISSTFLAKTYFLREPFKLIFSFYTMNIFLGGYCVYVIEESHPYLDIVWMMVVTMTTLGFGDIVPVSVVARGLVGFASILGIFLMALFISVVHELLQLTNQEKRILAYIEKAEHQQKKKNLAAACIQSCWRYRQFLKKHGTALDMGDWLKLQRMRYYQHKLFESMREWRGMRRAWTRDDYWRKLFVVDDTAMLLTDVCRSVTSIERGLRQSGKLRSPSRPSLCRLASYGGSPPARIREEASSDNQHRVSCTSHVSPMVPREKSASLQAVLVESWRSQQEERERLEKLDKQDKREKSATQREVPKICTNHIATIPGTPVSPVSDMERSRRPMLNRPEYNRKTSDLSTSSDHIDRGAMPVEMLQARIESVENALDEIYGKVKSELRDIKDAVSTLTIPVQGRTPLPSPGSLPSRTDRTSVISDPIFSYATMDKYDI